MSSPDRRPVLYAAVGAVILILAFFLFRPGGGGNDLPDTMVLRPQESSETDLQAVIDEGETMEAPVEEQSPAEEVGNDPFPVENATLESAEVSTPVKSVMPKTETAKRPLSIPSSQTPSLGGDYYVVVGSYGDPNNAQRLVQKLDANGVAAEIHSAQGANGPVHRVRVGYFADHSRAEAYGRKLQKDMKLDFWVSSR